MVASSLSPSHVLAVVPRDLVLRVRGPGRPGQVVRLRSTKCSIGSDSRCTLRLAARGVRAVHCVVFHGAERTIVRRWSSDTRLNGHAFTDAELCPGDRLSIGPIELDVLETGAVPAAREVLRSSRELDRRNTDADRDRGSLQAPQEGLQAPQEGLQASRESLQAKRDQNDDQEQRLQAETERLQASEENLRASREKLQLEEDNLRAELTEQRSRLDEERASIQEEHAQLDAERASLNEARKALGRKSEEWEQSCRQKESEIADRQAELDALAAEIRAEQLRVQCDAEASRASIDEESFEEEPTEKVKEAAPVALADVLRRLGKSDLLLDDKEELDDDDNAESMPRSGHSREHASSVEPRRSPAGGAKTHGEESGEDDVSVDEYMSQLMRRVRGKTEPHVAPRHASSERLETPRPAVAGEESRPESPRSRKPVKMTPRAPAPERTGFAAMRELANVSARAAVGQHARRQMRSASRSKLAVAVTAGLASAVLFWLWTTYLPIGVTVLAAATSFAIAVLWGLQYAVVTGRLLIGKNGRISFPRVDMAPEQPTTPVDEPSMSTDEAAGSMDGDSDGTEPDAPDE